MARHHWTIAAAIGVAAAMAASGPADAKAAKKAPAKTSSSSKKSTKKAATPAEPPKPRGPMVPQAVVLRPVTPEEATANAIWNVRAGLNIAALQCQFSPFLATVPFYNSNLVHHETELGQAMQTMIGHFRRYDGEKRAQASFDQYTTKTYNSYSTLDAQYSFCETASMVGRQALALPKGQLGSQALTMVAQLRASLTPHALTPMIDRVDPVNFTMPEIVQEP
jgi:hypothetical protein